MTPGVRTKELAFLTLFVCVGIASVLVLRDADWVGDPLWGQETVGISQVVTLPLAAGAAAVWGSRDRHGLLTLVERGAPTVRHLIRTIGVTSGVLAVIHLLASAAVWFASRTSPVVITTLSPWPLMTQVSVCVLAIVVGYALGYIVGNWLACVVAAFVFAASVTLDRMGVLNTGVAEYAASGTMYGAGVNGWYFLTRLAWIWALVVLILTLLAAGRRATKPASALMATMLIGAPILFGGNRSYDFAAPQNTTCVGSAPQICGPSVLATRVREAAPIAAEASTALSDLKGVTVATRRLEAWYPSIPRDRADVMLFNPGHIRDPLDTQGVINAVVAPTSCRIWTDPEPPPQSWFFASTLVMAYVNAILTGQPEAVIETSVRARGEDQTTDAIATAARALQECDTSILPSWFDTP